MVFPPVDVLAINGVSPVRLQLASGDFGI